MKVIDSSYYLLNLRVVQDWYEMYYHIFKSLNTIQIPQCIDALLQTKRKT